MIEKPSDYAFPSDFYVVKSLGLGTAGDMVTKFPLRENETCSNVSLLLYFILIMFHLKF